jgi:hypothetical protein
MAPMRRRLSTNGANSFVKRWSNCGRTEDFEQENTGPPSLKLWRTGITERTFWLIYADGIYHL